MNVWSCDSIRCNNSTRLGSQKIILSALLFLCMLNCGCGTYLNQRAYRDVEGKIELPESYLVQDTVYIYGGFLTDLRMLGIFAGNPRGWGFIPLVLIDLPFSFGADSVILPLTIYQQCVGKKKQWFRLKNKMQFLASIFKYALTELTSKEKSSRFLPKLKRPKSNETVTLLFSDNCQQPGEEPPEAIYVKLKGFNCVITTKSELNGKKPDYHCRICIYGWKNKSTVKLRVELSNYRENKTHRIYYIMRFVQQNGEWRYVTHSEGYRTRY